MIKFNKETMRYIVFGKLKSSPLGKLLNSRKSGTIRTLYEVEFKARPSYAVSKDPNKKYEFDSMAISLFMLGFRTEWNKTISSTFSVTMNGSEIIKESINTTTPIIIFKKDRNSKEADSYKLTVSASRELRVVDVKPRLNELHSVSEIFDVKVTKIN